MNTKPINPVIPYDDLYKAHLDIFAHRNELLGDIHKLRKDLVSAKKLIKDYQKLYNTQMEILKEFRG